MRRMVAAFALAMSFFGVIFFYTGVSLGWLYVSRTYPSCVSIQTLYFQSFMGTLLGSAVVPIALCTTWSKANKWGCINGAIWGLIAGIVAWIVTTARLNSNVINVETTGGDYEMLAGNLAAIGVGGIISVATSYFVSHFSPSFPAVITLSIYPFNINLFLCSTPRTSTSMLHAPLMPLSRLRLLLLPTREGPVPRNWIPSH